MKELGASPFFLCQLSEVGFFADLLAERQAEMSVANEPKLSSTVVAPDFHATLFRGVRYGALPWDSSSRPLKRTHAPMLPTSTPRASMAKPSIKGAPPIARGQ